MSCSIEIRVFLRRKMSTEVLIVPTKADPSDQWKDGNKTTATANCSNVSLSSARSDDQSSTVGESRRRKQSVPSWSTEYENADLMRLIASSISVRRAFSLEERTKMLERVKEETKCVNEQQTDANRGSQANCDRYRSVSESVSDNTSTPAGNENAPTDETMTPEEEALARQAVLRRVSAGSGALRKRSVQYDNPELLRLIATYSPMGARKASMQGRGSTVGEERLSYRTALEKLMPSSMVNERDVEETQDGKGNEDESENEEKFSENDQLDDGCSLTALADSICKIFQCSETGKICVSKFVNEITETGIRMADPRLSDSMYNLKRTLRQMGTDIESTRKNCLLDPEDFKSAIMNDAIFIHRVLRTSFVIPEWHAFGGQVFGLFSLCKNNSAGQVASLIPQLADFDPNLWAVSICTVDGQRFSAGDAKVPFLLQECARVCNYAMALNDYGAETVHSYVGQEPSGRNIRELVLDENQKPHNPMINAGAIVVASLLKDSYKHMADKFDAIYNFYHTMAGKEYIGFSNTAYLSERQVSYRNYALGYFLRENKCFPENAKLEETLELLLQLYAIEVNCESLSVMAATLANGGMCPTTGDFVIGSHCVRDVLSLMYSCGMNDYSGKFAFHVGLPARSNVSGGIMLVVPNVMGICVWSPSVDQHQNSVRGVQFCTELVKTFNFHNYDDLRFTQRKLDPRRMQVETKTQQVVLTLFSAANGDITALRRYLLQGVDLTNSDYDGRTPLHVAASEGHLHCVKFLLQKAHVPSRPLDRWHNTPADDARGRNFDEIADYLDRWYKTVESRPRASAPEVGRSAVKLSHPPRSIADTLADDISQCLSDYESGEGMSGVESWVGGSTSRSDIGAP